MHASSIQNSFCSQLSCVDYFQILFYLENREILNEWMMQIEVNV